MSEYNELVKASQMTWESWVVMGVILSILIIGCVYLHRRDKREEQENGTY